MRTKRKNTSTATFFFLSYETDKTLRSQSLSTDSRYIHFDQWIHGLFNLLRT